MVDKAEMPLVDPFTSDVTAELQELTLKLSEEIEKSQALEVLNQSYASIIDSYQNNVQINSKILDDDCTTIESQILHTRIEVQDTTTQTMKLDEDESISTANDRNDRESMDYQVETLRAELASRSNYVIKLEAERLSLFGLTDILRNELETIKSDKPDNLSELTTLSTDTMEKSLLLASSQQTMSELLVARARIQLLEKDMVKQTADIASALVEKSYLSSNLAKIEKEAQDMEDTYKAQLKELSSQIEFLRESLSNEREMRSSASQETKEIRQSMINSKGEVDDMITSLNARIATLLEERQIIEEKLKSFEHDMSTVQAERQIQSETLKRAIAENSNLSANVTNLLREQSSLKSDYESSLIELSKTQQKLRDSEESAALSAENHSKALSRLQEAKDRVIEENTRLSTSKNDLEKRLENLIQTTGSAETENLSQIQQLHQLTDQLRDQIQSLERDIESNKVQLDQSQKKVDALGSLELELESIRQRLTKTEMERDQLALSSEHLQSKLQTLTEESDRLSTTLAIVRESKAGSTAEVEHLRQELAEYKATTTLKHSALIDELHAARRQYNDETRRTAIATEHRDILASSNEKIGAELTEAKQKIDELEKIIRDMKNEGSTLRVQLTALQSYKSTLTQSLDAVREEFSKYKTQVEDQLTQKDVSKSTLEQRLVDLQRNLDDLQAQQSIRDKEFKRMTEVYHEDKSKLIEQLQSNQFQLEVLAQEKDLLEKRFKDLLSEKHALLSKLETAQLNHENLAKERQALEDSLKARISHLESEHRSLESNRQTLVDEIKSSKQAIADMSNAFEAAKADERSKMATFVQERDLLEKRVIDTLSEKESLSKELETSRLSHEIEIKERLAVEELLKARIVEMESMQRSMDNEKQTLLDEIASVNQAMTKLCEELEQNKADRSNFENQLSSALSESQSLTDKLNQMSSEKNLLEEHLAEKLAAEKSLKEEYTKVAKKLETALAAKDLQKQASKQDYELAVQTIASLEEQLLETRGDLESKEAEIDLLRNELGSLARTAETVKALQDERKQFLVKLNDLSTQVDSLRQESLANCAQIIELQEKKATSESLAARLDESLVNANARIRSLETQMAVGEASSNTQKSMVDTIITERDEILRQLEESRADRSSAQLIISSLQTKLSNTSAELEDKVKKIASLKYDQTATKRIIESLQTELEAIKDLLKKSASGEAFAGNQSPSLNLLGEDREAQLQELLQMKNSMQRQLHALQLSDAGGQMPMTGAASTQTSTESAGFVPLSISLMDNITNVKPAVSAETGKGGSVPLSYSDIHAKRSFTTGSPTKSPLLQVIIMKLSPISIYDYFPYRMRTEIKVIPRTLMCYRLTIPQLLPVKRQSCWYKEKQMLQE